MNGLSKGLSKMVKNEIWVLTIASSFLLAVLLFLLFYLIIRKALENQSRKQMENQKKRMSPLLLTFLTEGELSRELKPETKLKERALEELLTHYADLLEGVEEKQYLTVLAELHLAHYYRRSLKSIRWSRRMNALFHIEDFNMKMMQDDLVAIVETTKASKEELVLLLRILAAFHYENLPHLLINKWSHLTEYDYRTILYRLDGDSLEPFILEFNKCSEQLKFAIIEVISLKKEVKYVRFLEHIFSVNERELRLRSLKAIASIGYVSTLRPYLSLATSSIWQERMMAAKLFGNMKDRELIGQLSVLLGDSSWWVRFQAGQSIMMFSDGKEILHDIYQTSKDSFARDMAWEWMNKGVM